MVADVHRTIKYGGIFLYPKSDDAPTGKLRVLYECMPMAHILEKAGGAASDGYKPILVVHKNAANAKFKQNIYVFLLYFQDIVPTGLHVRSPIFLGSKDDVKDVVDLIAKHSKK